MSKDTIIKEGEIVSLDKACQLLGDISKTTLAKYVKQKFLRRVRDRTNGNKAYIYKPDIDSFLNSRYYFE